MALSDSYHRIPLELIDVRPDRQRKNVDVSDLLISIKLRGVIQPIIVEESTEVSGRYALVAGERRLRASRDLGNADIPARMAGTLTSIERELIELEENVKRHSLPWQDEIAAVRRIHAIFESTNSDWNQLKTAEQMGMSPALISMYLRIAEEVQKGNPNILQAQGIRAAYGMLSRKNDRAIADAMNEFLFEEKVEPSPISSAISSVGKAITNIAADFSDAQSIIQVDFHIFAEGYQGPPFNFLHCDFPYGINHHESDQGNQGELHQYEDTPEMYWELCNALCKNINKLVAPSAHLMFWLSSDIRKQHETLSFFEKNAPDLEFQSVPLIWHKTDNRGILPDPKRAPRRVYETALIASRGDRLIIRAVSNAYGSPTTKEVHQSEKPEPMLRHFFQMFIDENSRVFDPTCGSGTSLRAAESLGAAQVLGLEINEGFVEGARIKLRQFRNLRKI